MTTIEIKQYRDISVEGDINLVVRRKLSWFGKITLRFELGSVVVLETVRQNLIPFSRTKIKYQNLPDVISIKRRRILSWEGNEIEMWTNIYWTFTKNFGDLFFGTEHLTKIIKVSNNFCTTGVVFELDFTTTNNKAMLYAVILTVLTYSNIDLSV